MYHIKNTKINPAPTMGMYCLIMASKLILCALLLYFNESLFKLDDKSLILSNESPLYNKSSMFFVMTFLTSAKSLFNLSKFDCAL